MSRGEHDGGEPKVVTLIRGGVHAEVLRRLRRVMAEFHRDPDLEVAAATGVLWGVALDLLFRLDMYTVLPFSICRLCRCWFPTTFLRSCCDFLHTRVAEVDLGFSLPFQEEAWAQGVTENGGVNWLASDAVQAFLERLVVTLFVTSLEAERKAAQVKMSVARKLSHIATISRNLICAGYQRWRMTRAAAVDEAAGRLRRAIRTNESALAWAHEGGAVGAGSRFQQG